MTPNEIKEKSAVERAKLLKELREEFFQLNLKKTTSQLEKTHRLSEIKKDIARLLTIKRSEELAGKSAA